MVEQWSDMPKVEGSNPSAPTNLLVIVRLTELNEKGFIQY